MMFQGSQSYNIVVFTLDATNDNELYKTEDMCFMGWFA